MLGHTNSNKSDAEITRYYDDTGLTPSRDVLSNLANNAVQTNNINLVKWLIRYESASQALLAHVIRNRRDTHYEWLLDLNPDEALACALYHQHLYYISVFAVLSNGYGDRYYGNDSEINAILNGHSLLDKAIAKVADRDYSGDHRDN